MPDSRRDQLRAELIRLRLQAGLGGRPLMRKITEAGWTTTQATISRVERGITKPAVPLVREWAKACGADTATVDRLVLIAEALQTQTLGWSDLLDEFGHMQREIRDREQASVRVRNFQPTLIPGLLQTPEYARAVLALGRTRDVEAAVAERIERQKVLYETGRRFEFLLAEHHPLRWPPGGSEVLAAQRDRIVSLCRLPSVEVAVLPTSTVVLAPWLNFVIWDLRDDRRLAGAETWLGEQRAQDGVEVELLEDVWRQLWAAAVHGDEAVALIQGVR